MNSNSRKTGNGDDASGRWALMLSRRSLTIAAAFLILAVTWCFYIGFLVGRGQNPEKHLEEIAAILQTRDQAQAPSPAEPSAQQQADAQTQQSADPTQEALAGAVTGAVAAGAAPVQPAGAAPEKPSPAPQAQLQQQTKPKTETTGPRYQWTLQLGALRSEADAKKVAAKCQAKGIRAQVKKNGKVWILTATVRGTEADRSKLLSQLRSVGLGTPMQLSKKEIR